MFTAEIEDVDLRNNWAKQDEVGPHQTLKWRSKVRATLQIDKQIAINQESTD
jgi:hypothetical protein